MNNVNLTKIGVIWFCALAITELLIVHSCVFGYSNLTVGDTLIVSEWHMMQLLHIFLPYL